LRYRIYPPKIIKTIKCNIAEETIFCYNELNPLMDNNKKDFLVKRMNRKQEQSSLLENKIIEQQEKNRISEGKEVETEEEIKEYRKLEERRFMPNMAVQEEVELFEPVSIREVNNTRRILNEELESLEDENAVFQIVNKIAESKNLKFIVVDSEKEKKNICMDLFRRPTDTALENETITENTFHLLGSSVAEHNVKGISIHLQGSLDNISDYKEKKKYIENVRSKLAKVHKVSLDKIIIHSVTAGSIKINYTVSDVADLNENLDSEMKKLLPGYLGCDIHPSFLYMRIDGSSFNQTYNRDYSVDANCPKNEKRAGQPYNPPRGWYRYGMNVNGKFDNGEDTWLGMENVKGEWCVAYHGTKHSNVKSISSSPLRVGPRSSYGRGIYCSPYPCEAEYYCSDIFNLNIKGEGIVGFKYMFMCRVNVSNIHHCKLMPCPDAENPNYTIHFTISKDEWFVNLNNSNYENIRQYGILIKRC
jgi:hypothetical protein